MQMHIYERMKILRKRRKLTSRAFVPAVDECYFYECVLSPKPFSLSLFLRRQNGRRFSREWSDVSSACLCLTPRIFPLNFLDAKIYHRLQSRKNLLRLCKAIPITIPVPRDPVKRIERSIEGCPPPLRKAFSRRILPRWINQICWTDLGSRYRK